MITPKSASQPSLQDLTARFLAARAATGGEVENPGEVVPHEVVGGFRAPTRLTWDEALAVFRLFGVEPEMLPIPPEWAAVVNLDTEGVGVPLAAGLFPQRFRQVPGAFATGPVGTPSAAHPQPGFTALRGWIKKALKSKSATNLLVAAGVATVLGDHADADAALVAAEELCTAAWRAIWENQHAAVLWLRGNQAQAARLWASADDRPAIVFNRGLSALFGGNPAASQLRAAAIALPASSGWSHLASLYAGIAESPAN